MKNKKYITPKTQVKKIDTETLMAGSDKPVLTIDRINTAGNSNGGFAKKGSSIWEEN